MPWKYEFPFKGFVVSMISFPIALPGIVVAFMIIVLLGRQGLLTHGRVLHRWLAT